MIPELAPQRFLWLRQAITFSVVGILAAAIDYGVLASVISCGLSPGPARIPAVAVALVFTWIMNRKVTFATETPPCWKEFIHYAYTAVTGIVINLGIYWSAVWLHLPIWLAFTSGTGTAAIFNFLRYRALLHRQ